MGLDFSNFDARDYQMVDVRTGYREWVPTYEDTVEDAMDVALLDELPEPAWDEVRRAADLGCGTGRTGEMREGVVDDRWLAVKPKWDHLRHHPVSAAFAWRRPA